MTKKMKIDAMKNANKLLNDVNNKLTEMGMEKISIPENDKKQKTPRKKKVVELVEKVEQVEDKPKKTRGRPRKVKVENNLEYSI